MKTLFMLSVIVVMGLSVSAVAENLLGVVYGDSGFTVQFADGCLIKQSVTVQVVAGNPVQLAFVPYHSTRPCPIVANGSQISYQYEEFGQSPGTKFVIVNQVKPGTMTQR